jgi:hypothetical protein
LSFGPVAAGTIAVAWRPRAVRAVSSRPVAVFSKTLAARRIGSFLTIAIPRRIRFLVAELLVGEPRRTSVAAIATRRAVVAIIVRTIAAGGIRPLFAATVLARLE